jgi:hypothetical protein
MCVFGDTKRTVGEPAGRETLGNPHGLMFETRKLLAKSEGTFGTIVWRRDAPVGRLAEIDMSLVEAMAAVLNDMTANAWPDRVLVLSGADNEVQGDDDAILA